MRSPYVTIRRHYIHNLQLPVEGSSESLSLDSSQLVISMKNTHSRRHVLSAQEDAESGQLKKAEMMAAEIEEGNNEYKFKLTDLSDDQFIHRITQLNWRLNEGGDEAVYEIGVEDDGNPLGLSSEDLEESLANLKRMADTVGCDMTVQQFRKGEVGITAKVLLRRTERLLVTPVHVQVAVAGPADTGKSTLIAVLSSGNGLDNGKGLARTQIFKHNHEVMSGRTSSNTQHNLYFGADGAVLNSDVEGSSSGSGKGCSNRLRSRSDMELADETCRTISFIDLAGSSKYLKTTLHGIVGHSPDYFILAISAKRGMEQMTSEFLGLCFALQLNLMIVLTKVDTVSSSVVTKVAEGLLKMLQRSGSATVKGRRAILIESPDHLINLVRESARQNTRDDSLEELAPTIVPIFKVSSVTGDGLDILRSHLFQLPNHTRCWAGARAQLTQVRIIGSFEKRDEKSVSEPIQSDDAYIISKRSVGGGESSIPQRCQASSDTSVGQRNSDSTSIPSDVDHTNEVDGQDSTSIASLWTTSSSPSPPPVAPSTARTCDGSEEKTSLPVPFPQSEIAELEDSRMFTTESTSCAKNGSCDPLISSIYHRELDQNDPRVIAASSFMGPETVLFGQVLSGVLTHGDRLVLGPIGIEGSFSVCSVQSVRVNDVPVRSAVAGQTATMILKLEVEETVRSNSLPPIDENVHYHSGGFNEEANPSSASLNSLGSGATTAPSISTDGSDNIRNSSSFNRIKPTLGQGQGCGSSSISAGSGLVLLSPDFNPVAYWEFEAEVLIINHPGKVRVSYEPVVHFLGCCVRQSARIVDIKKMPPVPKRESHVSREPDDVTSIESSDETALVTGDRAICKFRFLYRPEYVFLSASSDNAMVIREGRTKGVGKLLSLSCPSSATKPNPDNIGCSRI